MIDGKQIWAEVQANSKTLLACPGPHDFQPTEPGRLFSKFRCTKCGGTCRGDAVHWYKQGLKHGKL